MKNTIKLFMMITFIAVIGFSIVACDDLTKDVEPAFEGTWGYIYTPGEFTFTGNNFEFHKSFDARRMGTFTKTASQITFNSTHEHEWNGSNWVFVPIASPPNTTFLGGDFSFFDNGIPVNYNFEYYSDGTVGGITIDGKYYRR